MTSTNIIGTPVITARLYWIGNKAASLNLGHRGSFLGITYIVLESRVIFSSIPLVLVILGVYPPTIIGSVAGVNVVAKLAVSDYPR